jgi:aminoglycoside 2'-N-acetyltransferase I
MVRTLVERAFGDDFGEDDWSHCLGGWHVVVRVDGAPVAHAAIVPRTLTVSGRPLRAGYVEGVATEPSLQGRGHGSAVMREAAALLRERFELGALSTSRHAFYERLGWERWRGPAYVSNGVDAHRTPDEDDGIMVLRYGSAAAALDLAGPICCEGRPGDDW